jgi:hypothetical protein
MFATRSRSHPAPTPPPCFRPTLEALEERLTPSTSPNPVVAFEQQVVAQFQHAFNALSSSLVQIEKDLQGAFSGNSSAQKALDMALLSLFGSGSHASSTSSSAMTSSMMSMMSSSAVMSMMQSGMK